MNGVNEVNEVEEVRDYANELENLERAVRTARVEHWELHLRAAWVLECQFRLGKMEIEREVWSRSYFLRVLDQKDGSTGVGVVEGSTFAPRVVDDLVATAVGLAKSNSGPPYQFPTPGRAAPRVQSLEPVVASDPKEALRRQVEAVQGELDECRSRPSFGKLRLVVSRTWLRNSNGLDLEKDHSSWFFEYSLVADSPSGKAEYWDDFRCKTSAGLTGKLPSWDQLARDSLVASHANGNPKATVVFSPKVFAELVVPVLGYHASGAAAHEKLTKFTDLGSRVAHESLTLQDDGLATDCTRCAPWDGEGSPSQTTTVVERGVFKSRIYDQTFGPLSGKESTGNGLRASTGTISNSPTNFVVAPGDRSLEELFEGVRDGLYVLKFSWLNPDPVTGTFGAEVRNAYRIEGGKLGAPVKGGSVSGNVFDVVRNLGGLSKQVEAVNNARVPWVGAEGLTVSG
ncbi:MAG: TldD/PmbA family protein [Promethearchaeota archaeon]